MKTSEKTKLGDLILRKVFKAKVVYRPAKKFSTKSYPSRKYWSFPDEDDDLGPEELAPMASPVTSDEMAFVLLKKIASLELSVIIIKPNIKYKWRIYYPCDANGDEVINYSYKFADTYNEAVCLAAKELIQCGYF